MRALRITGHVLSVVFECAMCAEIAWYVLHDGDQTLHEALAEWWERFREGVEERDRIRHTRDMIRDLPE